MGGLSALFTGLDQKYQYVMGSEGAGADNAQSIRGSSNERRRGGKSKDENFLCHEIGNRATGAQVGSLIAGDSEAPHCCDRGDNGEEKKQAWDRRRVDQ